jgi:hypothetical protein
LLLANTGTKLSTSNTRRAGRSGIVRLLWIYFAFMAGLCVLLLLDSAECVGVRHTFFWGVQACNVFRSILK